MTSDLLMIAGSVLGGAAIGVLFFGGLLLTTKRFADSPHAIRLVLGSFLARSLVALAGFFVIIRLAGFTGIMLSVLGFGLVQLVVLVRSTRRRIP